MPCPVPPFHPIDPRPILGAVINRRKFLATAGAVLGTVACGTRGAGALPETTAAAARRRLDRIGIQLYTVRAEMARDVAGTLARLAEIGYGEVEFAGYFGRTAAEIRAVLAANRLTAPSTHVAYDLIGSAWERALDDAAEKGHRYVTIPWLPESVRGSTDSWKRVADAFNSAASAARTRGLSFAYHNHEFEFNRVDGSIPFDILLENTDRALVHFQMDVFWTVKGGADPLGYLRRHPDRFPMLHIKDSAGPPAHRQVDVGAGTIDFAAVLRQAVAQQHPVEHAFVEHDSPPDPMLFAKKSFDHMKALEF